MLKHCHVDGIVARHINGIVELAETLIVDSIYTVNIYFLFFSLGIFIFVKNEGPSNESRQRIVSFSNAKSIFDNFSCSISHSITKLFYVFRKLAMNVSA